MLNVQVYAPPALTLFPQKLLVSVGMPQQLRKSVVDFIIPAT
jgi:hypothetical protein